MRIAYGRKAKAGKLPVENEKKLRAERQKRESHP